MILYSELGRRVAARFPGVGASLPHALWIWAQDDDDSELERALAGAGLSVSQLPQALEPLLAEPSEDEARFLTARIVAAHRPLTGCGLLAGLCQPPGRELRVAKVLGREGLDFDVLRRNLQDQAVEPALRPALRQQPCTTFEGGKARLTDLVARAVAGDFDDLEARPELDQLCSSLLRAYKPNVVLTGPAGAGKTALIGCLARQLHRGEVPEPLQGYRLFEVRPSELVAGTRYRGDFEERMHTALREAQSHAPAIVFIDEMHLLNGAGRAEGAALDGANLLKPILTEGSLHIVAATTTQEYHRYLAADSALARRFHEVRVTDPSPELLRAIIVRKARRIANHHRLRIPESTVAAAIALTNRYLPHQHQPDKAVTLLDTCAANLRRTQGKQLLEQHLQEEIATVVGRTIVGVEGGDRTELRALAKRLRQRIVGQDPCIDRIVATLAYRLQALGSEERNMGTFLFAGPTGVGKTGLAQALAEELFGGPTALLHVDLGEYTTAGTESKLIGAAPGYLGSDREGVLANWLRERGRGVLLFDEVEKAHPSIQLLLLGLLDNGRIRTGQGDSLDTRGSVVILTTNAVRGQRSAIGFGQQAVVNETELFTERFPSEFLGRFDETILFNGLAQPELEEILRRQLDAAMTRFRSSGITLSYDEQPLVAMLRERLEPSSGARGAARLVERGVLQPVALELLSLAGPREAIRARVEVCPSASSQVRLVLEHEARPQ